MFARRCGPCGRLPKDTPIDASGVVLSERPPAKNAVRKAPKPPAKALPDFNGKWQLSASRNFDAYLTALGVNYVKRQLAAGMKPVQDWTRLADGTWQFVVQSPIGLKTEAFPIGKEVLTEVDGTPVLKTSQWDGDVLETIVQPTDPKKAEAYGEMSMCAPPSLRRRRARARRRPIDAARMPASHDRLACPPHAHLAQPPIRSPLPPARPARRRRTGGDIWWAPAPTPS